MTKTHDEMSLLNRASLYGLLNFYLDYVPRFAELTEPIRPTFSQDSSECTPAASGTIKHLAAFLVESPRWVNMALD